MCRRERGDLLEESDRAKMAVVMVLMAVMMIMLMLTGVMVMEVMVKTMLPRGEDGDEEGGDDSDNGGEGYSDNSYHKDVSGADGDVGDGSDDVDDCDGDDNKDHCGDTDAADAGDNDDGGYNSGNMIMVVCVGGNTDGRHHLKHSFTPCAGCQGLAHIWSLTLNTVPIFLIRKLRLTQAVCLQSYSWEGVTH